MDFWCIQPLLVWIEHRVHRNLEVFFLLGLLLTKVGRDFAHLVLKKNAPSPLRTMQFFFNSFYMMLFTNFFQICMFVQRLLNFFSDVGNVWNEDKHGRRRCGMKIGFVGEGAQ